MPLTRSAIKKLRQDKKRESENKKFEAKLLAVIKKAEKNPKPENIKSAVSFIDKAVKKNIIHQNKGSRLKSQISKQNPIKVDKSKKTIKSAKSKTPKKTVSKK